MNNSKDNFQTIFKPGEPTAKEAAARKKFVMQMRIGGIVFLAAGIVMLIMASGDIVDLELQTVGFFSNSIGSLLLLISFINPIWHKWARLNTFIGVDQQGKLSMWSPFKYFPCRFAVPIEHVSTIIRATGSGKENGWYFKGRNIKEDVRFNPRFFPAKTQKSVLAELVKYGKNIKITTQQPQKTKSSGFTKDEQEAIFMAGSQDDGSSS